MPCRGRLRQAEYVAASFGRRGQYIGEQFQSLMADYSIICSRTRSGNVLR